MSQPVGQVQAEMIAAIKLREMARRLSLLSQQLSGLKGQLTVSKNIDWHSAAAVAFRESVDARSVTVGSCSSAMEAVAGELMSRASVVESLGAPMFGGLALGGPEAPRAMPSAANFTQFRSP